MNEMYVNGPDYGQSVGADVLAGSIDAEPPSYELSQSKYYGDEEPEVPATTQVPETVPLLRPLPPLVPVRRGTVTTALVLPTQADVHEPPPSNAIEPQSPLSPGISIYNAMRIAGGDVEDRSSTVLIQRHSHFAIPRPRPTANVEFVFAHAGPNAMLLLPPPDERDARPRYYITVFPNCFMPLSHITTVYRGGSVDAPRVGEFEMGIFAGPNYRQIGNHPPENLSDVLKKKGARVNGKWTWTRKVGSVPSHLYWNCNVMPFICSTQPPDSADNVSLNNTIAWFTPRHMNRGSHAPTTSYQLQVTPRGQHQMLFDDIVMSILAIQRRVLRPTTDEVQGLFNDCTPGF